MLLRDMKMLWRHQAQARLNQAQLRGLAIETLRPALDNAARLPAMQRRNATHAFAGVNFISRMSRLPDLSS